MVNPKISVIMSVYNGERYLKESIDSILNQTFSNFEFIIINDASTDNTLNIIKSYNDSRIKLIKNEKNIGLTRSLNKGLKIAKGEYIARQDADDISVCKRFENQIDYLKKNSNVVLLGTNAFIIAKNGKITGKRLVSEIPTLNNLIKLPQFIHGSVIYKKDVICKLRGYNEIFRYSQDYELWLRVAKNYEVRNLKYPLYKLRTHNESIGFRKIEESWLYHLLAIKLINNDLKESSIEAIKDNNIFHLYNYLNQNETLDFKKQIYKQKANQYILNNKPECARIYYKKIFKIDPFDYINNISIIMSYLGKKIVFNASKLYNQINFIFNVK